MGRSADRRSLLAASAALGAGGAASVVVATLTLGTAAWGSTTVATWTATAVVLVVLGVVAAAHRGPVPRVLRQIIGLAAAAAAGRLLLVLSLWAWGYATSAWTGSSQLWREHAGVVLRDQAVPAAVCAVVALLLLTDGPGLVPGRQHRLQVALLAGATGAVATGAVGLSQEFVQQGESLQALQPGLLPVTVLALVVLAAVAAAGRVHAGDALTLLAGTILLDVAGLLLTAAFVRTGTGLLGGVKQVLPAAAAAALALAAAPALRRRGQSL